MSFFFHRFKLYLFMVHTCVYMPASSTARKWRSDNNSWGLWGLLLLVLGIKPRPSILVQVPFLLSHLASKS